MEIIKKIGIFAGSFTWSVWFYSFLLMSAFSTDDGVTFTYYLIQISGLIFTGGLGYYTIRKALDKIKTKEYLNAFLWAWTPVWLGIITLALIR